MSYLIMYLIIGVIVLLVNSLIAGFQGEKINYDSLVDIVIWPVEICTLLGIITRVIYAKIRSRNE